MEIEAKAKDEIQWGTFGKIGDEVPPVGTVVLYRRPAIVGRNQALELATVISSYEMMDLVERNYDVQVQCADGCVYDCITYEIAVLETWEIARLRLMSRE